MTKTYALPPPALPPVEFIPTSGIAGTAEVREMLSFRRPAGCKTERKFIRRYIEPLGAKPDAYGNYVLRVGDPTHPIMWSCHTDTVHRLGGRQKVSLGASGRFWTTDKHSSCLGGDDTGGVWLLRHMIQARKPGLYVFHREEEIGGRGSRWLAKKTPKVVEGITHCIALDRKGTGDIITCQGGRTASTAFAEDLAARLTKAGLPGFAPCTMGMWTDSASYTDLIGECTNLSIGYQGAHSAAEELSMAHLLRLRDALIALDTEGLTQGRKPGEKETYTYPRGSYKDDWGGYGSSYGYGRGSTRYWDSKAQKWVDTQPATPATTPATTSRATPLTTAAPAAAVIWRKCQDGWFRCFDTTTNKCLVERGKGSMVDGKFITALEPREVAPQGSPDPTPQGEPSGGASSYGADPGDGALADFQDKLELADMLRANPCIAAQLLWDYGITPNDFAEEVYRVKGEMPRGSGSH